MKMSERTPQENTISNLSSYSTIVFGLALFVAVVLDIVYPIKFVAEPLNRYLGVALILLGTIIVYWAERLGKTFSEKRRKGEITAAENLSMGPYFWTRNPKYLALAILLIGLGVTINSLFVMLSSIVSLVIINYFLLSKEEELMETRHGEIYHEYKKKVRKWLRKLLSLRSWITPVEPV
jgi:protein-S-isoprenylcysteine O-methyltransferase Ste14